MFNFIKKGVNVNGGPEKDDEKEKRKREKKMRKESKQAGLSSSMSTEELLRLDEIRRSLKIRSRRKEKEKEKLPSGITADYSAEFFAQLDIDRGAQSDRDHEEVMASTNTTIDTTSSYSSLISDSSANKLSPAPRVERPRNSPPVPPKPPKRGILKAPKVNVTMEMEEHMTVLTDTSSVYSINSTTVESRKERLVLDNLMEGKHDSGGPMQAITSPTPSAESFTDTTNSSFATPPFSLSPVGESHGVYGGWANMQNFEDITLPLPVISFVTLPPPRDLSIKRQNTPRNDFGFSLRKAICLDRTSSVLTPTFKPVIFAEPGAMGNATGLLPGDRLLKVNDVSVEDLARETIIEMIRNSGSCVRVQVQPVNELVELSKRCMPSGMTWTNGRVVEEAVDETDRVGTSVSKCNTLRRSASTRFKAQAKTLRNGESTQEKLVWLVHRGGFCAARVVKAIDKDDASESSPRLVVELLHNGEQITVDEDDTEKTNPSNLDLVEDICQLNHLNEASILHCLRQRYANNLIHTNAGPILIVVNPMAPLSLYSEKVVSMFRGCKSEDMPPHIYSTSQNAYRALMETRRDQSLVFMGRSGSGKTTSFKHALYYLTLIAGSANKVLTAEKVNAINTITEAFGNSRTSLNLNATRFTQIFGVDFDHSGQIVSASVQVLLLEMSRIGRKWGNDYTFHVLSELIIGAEGNLKKELQLDHISSDGSNPFISLPQKIEDRQKASAGFGRLCQAFTTLGVDPILVKTIWSALAAVYHLTMAGVAKNAGVGNASKIQFANPTAARKASNLLGISMDELVAMTFAPSTNGSSSPLRSPNGSLENAWESLEWLIIGIYSDIFGAVVNLINKAISTSTANTMGSIILLDTPGFQNPASCGNGQMGASLSDFKFNYIQERLQLLFHFMTIVAPMDRYSQELIDIDFGNYNDTSPAPVVSLIDKTPQNQIIRTSQRDLRQQDRRGIFWLLDEESIYPNSTDDTFFERMFNHFSDREHQAILRRTVGCRQFVIQHLQGTNPVLYSATGWLRASRDHSSIKAASTLLQNSSKENVNRLFVGSTNRGVCSMFHGSIVGLDSAPNLRRVSSIRRSFTTNGVRKNSLMLQFKFTVDAIVDIIRRTGTHFIHCYLLQHNAGTTSIINQTSTSNAVFEDIVNIPLLRSQMRGSQVIESARLHKMGFPEIMASIEFVRRFGLLGDSGTENLESILINNDVDPASYRIGPSQVFCRSGVLNQLEAKRDELLSDRIIKMQACCRGYLARRKMARRRVQEIAVRCIQRNVKAFLGVRDWPWWRLLVRVTPLLNVHRTEEQLKSTIEEMQTLKSRLEKLELERNVLKADNEKLENKLSEATCELQEERSTSNLTNERLDAEVSERLKLEKELEYQDKKVKELQETTDKLELELICAKSDINGISEDEDGEHANGESGASVYRIKYERAARELEFTKRRLQTQHEHDLEQLVGLKKQLEKKLADAYEEVEEQRQVVAQWKRKHQKMTNEMNDLRMLLEEQNARNNILEKKQRKFDAECLTIKDSTRLEKQAKEKLAQEKEILIAEKFTLEQNLADTKLDLELKEEKLTAMQRELEELSFAGATEEEIATLKRAKIESERRCKEQEEELDDLAGQVQLLEQSKLRLEMTIETMRKDSRREAQQREDELEDVRGSMFKKVKALECQLENEHEERTLLLREKNELERRLVNLQDQDRVDRANEEVVNHKLRRDLRKYKALLKDTQAQLERLKSDSPNKAMIRQMKNQLEDVETARTIAVKARQTAETELSSVQQMLEDAQRSRSDAEEKVNRVARERIELQSQIEENEEEMSELMRRFTTTVKQLNLEQSVNSDFEIKVTELEMERNSLKEQVAELMARLENVENMSDPSVSLTSKKQELRIKELESKLELEMATKSRVEVQYNRNKETIERLQMEIQTIQHKEAQTQEALRRNQKSLRELREEFHTISNREQENLSKRKDLEKRLEVSETEAVSLKNDLRLALQRITDLQQAMEEGDSGQSDSDLSTDGSMSDYEMRAGSVRTKSKPRRDFGDMNRETTPRVLSTPSGSSPKSERDGVGLKTTDSSFA